MEASHYCLGGVREDDQFREGLALLEGVGLEELLYALARIRADMLSVETYDEEEDAEYDTACGLVGEAMSLNFSDAQCLEILASYARTTSTNTLHMTKEILARSDKQWAPSTIHSALPGLLSRELYDAINIVPMISRTSYLRLQLFKKDLSLTSAQREVGRALAIEWGGTLDSLVETTRSLVAR
jgi:hypothetical protein